MTYNDKKRRLWDYYHEDSDNPVTPTEPEYNVFGAAPPGVYTSYTDGDGGIVLMMVFALRANHQLANPRCVGARLWTPTVEPGFTDAVMMSVSDVVEMSVAPLQTKVVPTVAGGWTDTTWDAPIPLDPAGQRVAIRYQFAGTSPGANTRYLHTPNLRSDSDPLVAPSGKVELVEAPSSYFRTGEEPTRAAPSNFVGYGLDIRIQ